MKMAERGGFEPPDPQGVTRFRVVPFQPGSRTSPHPKESPQQLRRFRRAHAAAHFKLVIAAIVATQVVYGSERSCFRLCAPKNHSCDARLDHRSHTHHARFHRNVYRRIREAVIRDRVCRSPQRHHLGMCGRVIQTDRRVGAAADHALFVDNDSANWHFASDRSLARQADGHVHENLIDSSTLLELQRTALHRGRTYHTVPMPTTARRDTTSWGMRVALLAIARPASMRK